MRMTGLKDGSATAGVGGAAPMARISLRRSEAVPLGVVPEELRRIDGNVVVVAGPKGADREAVARALHLAGNGADALFFIDRANDGHTVFTSAETAPMRMRPASGDTLFVEDAERLEVGTRRELASQVERLNARLILGVEPSAIPDVAERADYVISIQPLDERRADIPVLAASALRDIDPGATLSDDAIAYLCDRSWPGDVAEVRETIRCAAESLKGGDEIDVSALRAAGTSSGDVRSSHLSLAELERDHILQVLDENEWNRTRSARILGIDVKTLYNKLKRYKAQVERAQQKANFA